MQVRADRAEARAPSGPKALITYLERVKGVGPMRAARLYQRHGEHVLDAIDADPRMAFKDAGLSARQAATAASSWDQLRSTARAAPAARAARAGVACAAHRQALRPARAPRRAR